MTLTPQERVAQVAAARFFLYMHSILYKLLGRRGIETIDELDTSEKNTFTGWEKILSKEELTVADIKSFCGSQVDIIEAKWKDYGLDDAKKASLIPYHTVYKTLLAAIDSPKAAKEQLEMQLNQMID